MLEIILALIVFFIAYKLGKRRGWQDGFAQAEALTPLRLRQESHEKGYCCLCHFSPEPLADITFNERSIYNHKANGG